ncbi:MAG: CapA family protein [Deltaproteobacteria bacterium]|jgi:poly-gamma-glutamate synthesis protein (capsule biosynthesis protein)|nr:CapA family protein [Deltaproteobacteria bacterium]
MTGKKIVISFLRARILFRLRGLAIVSAIVAALLGGFGFTSYAEGSLTQKLESFSFDKLFDLKGLKLELGFSRPAALRGKRCSLKLIAVGDVLIHDSLRRSAATDAGYDFQPPFEHVAGLLKQADLVIANLENPLAGADRKFSGYPNFNAPDELASGLRKAGFTAVTVANNHSLDRGWSGLERTLKTVDAAGLKYIGAYASPDDKLSRLVSVHNGIKVALLAYTYGLNGRAPPKAGEEWRLGVIDLDLIFRDMAQARDQGADFVILSLHFGNEYQRKPSSEQKELVSKLLAGGRAPGQAGPDLILGHHPHVVQPLIYLAGKGGRPSQAVIYSLGNFITSQPFPYTDLGLILDVQLSIEADGRRTIGPFRLIPTYCQKGADKKGRFFRVIPLELAAKRPQDYGIGNESAKKLAKQFFEMARHLTSMLEPIDGLEPTTAQAIDPLLKTH